MAKTALIRTQDKAAFATRAKQLAAASANITAYRGLTFLLEQKLTGPITPDAIAKATAIYGEDDGIGNVIRAALNTAFTQTTQDRRSVRASVSP